MNICKKYNIIEAVFYLKGTFCQNGPSPLHFPCVKKAGQVRWLLYASAIAKWSLLHRRGASHLYYCVTYMLLSALRSSWREERKWMT